MQLDRPTQIGPYEVRNRLGKGGMGVVYLAYDPALDRLVAVKVLRVLDEDIRRRFLKEAKFAARVQHPNIVSIYGVGEHEGSPYIAMEYIAGQTLADVIHGGGRVGISRKVQWLWELASGLEYAHRHGIVHRDVKPSNLMIGRDSGLLRLLDFGIARDHESDATMSGVAIGTPHYMSPEQVTGQPVDARSDVFAFGAVAYELLSGQRAFDGAHAFEITKHVLENEPVPLTELVNGLPLELVRLIEGCLVKSLESRTPSLTPVLSSLRWIVRSLEGADDSTVIRPTPTAGTASSHNRANRQERRQQQVASKVAHARAALEAGSIDKALEAADEAAMLDEHDSAVHALLRDLERAQQARAAESQLLAAQRALDDGEPTDAEGILAALEGRLVTDAQRERWQALISESIQRQRATRCHRDIEALLDQGHAAAAVYRFDAEPPEVQADPVLLQTRDAISAIRSEQAAREAQERAHREAQELEAARREQAERERLAREAAAAQEAAARAAREAQERAAREAQERESARREQIERERLAREADAQEAAARAAREAQEQAAREAQERAAREAQEREAARREQIERERLAREAAAQEAAARAAREAQERAAREAEEREAARREQIEWERLAREAAAQEAAARAAREAQERAAREAQEREAARREQIERERLAREAAAQEAAARAAREAQERAAREAQEREAARREQIERERLAREAAAQEAAARAAREAQEQAAREAQERAAREAQEREVARREQIERDRLAREAAAGQPVAVREAADQEADTQDADTQDASAHTAPAAAGEDRVAHAAHVPASGSRSGYSRSGYLPAATRRLDGIAAIAALALAVVMVAGYMVWLRSTPSPASPPIARELPQATTSLVPDAPVTSSVPVDPAATTTVAPQTPLPEPVPPPAPASDAVPRALKTAEGLRRAGQLERAIASLVPEALATPAGAQLAADVIVDAERRMAAARRAADTRGAGDSPVYAEARRHQQQAEAARTNRGQAAAAVRLFLEAVGEYERAVPRPPSPPPSFLAKDRTEEPPPVVTLPKPETTPAPEAPKAPSPAPANPEPLILAQLDAFERAYESRSVAAVEAVWPGMPDAWRQGLQKSFRDYSEVEWRFTGRAMTVKGDAASVLADAVVTSVSGGRRLVTPRRYEFVLRARNNVWTISDVRLR